MKVSKVDKSEVPWISGAEPSRASSKRLNPISPDYRLRVRHLNRIGTKQFVVTMIRVPKNLALLYFQMFSKNAFEEIVHPITNMFSLVGSILRSF